MRRTSDGRSAQTLSAVGCGDGGGRRRQGGEERGPYYPYLDYIHGSALPGAAARAAAGFEPGCMSLKVKETTPRKRAAEYVEICISCGMGLCLRSDRTGALVEGNDTCPSCGTREVRELDLFTNRGSYAPYGEGGWRIRVLSEASWRHRIGPSHESHSDLDAPDCPTGVAWSERSAGESDIIEVPYDAEHATTDSDDCGEVGAEAVGSVHVVTCLSPPATCLNAAMHSFTTSDVAFCRREFQDRNRGASPFLLVLGGHMYGLDSTGPFPVRSVSDLFISPWEGCADARELRRTFAAQGRVADLVNIVVGGVIRLLCPLSLTSWLSAPVVVFDAPLPCYDASINTP